MFHLQTDRNGVHQKGHWGYCNDDLGAPDLGLFVRNADEGEGGNCPMPKTDKPSPKPSTTTTQKPQRRKPTPPKPQARKTSTQKPIDREPTTSKPQDYMDDYEYYYDEPSPKTSQKLLPRRKNTQNQQKTKGTVAFNSYEQKADFSNKLSIYLSILLSEPPIHRRRRQSTLLYGLY
jgi:hypothetical protein